MEGVGGEQPTLLITDDIERISKQPFACYAERMTIDSVYVDGQPTAVDMWSRERKTRLLRTDTD